MPKRTSPQLKKGLALLADRSRISPADGLSVSQRIEAAAAEGRQLIKPVQHNPAPAKRRGQGIFRWVRRHFRLPDDLNCWLERVAQMYRVPGGVSGLLHRFVVYFLRNPGAFHEVLTQANGDRAGAGRSEGTIDDGDE